MLPNRNRIGLNRFLLYQQRALALIALLLTNPYNREFWVHPFTGQARLIQTQLIQSST